MQHGKLHSYVEGKCRCDECCAVGRPYFREYRKAHPPPASVAKEYRKENLESILVREAKYREANREQRYAYGVEYKRKKGAELRAKERSVDGKAKRRLISSGRRAKLRDQFIEDVDPRVVYQMHGGCCGICKEYVQPDRYHVDHIIPIARGGMHGYINVQLAHPRCNQSKGAR